MYGSCACNIYRDELILFKPLGIQINKTPSSLTIGGLVNAAMHEGIIRV